MAEVLGTIPLDLYTQTVLESCDDLTRAELEEMLNAGYSIEEAVEELEAEGLLW